MDAQTNIAGLVSATNQKDYSAWDYFLHGENAVNFTSEFDTVGINENNIDNIEEDINTLIINPINQILDEFGGGTGVFDKGLKGDANEAAAKYIQAVKNLLLAYVSTYKNFITLCYESLEAMKQNDAGNAEVIQNAQQTIQQMANEIQVN